MNTPFLDTARRVIRCESEALTLLADSLDDRFRAAVDLMRACKGRVIVTGIGNRAISATRSRRRWPLPARLRNLCTRQRRATAIWG